MTFDTEQEIKAKQLMAEWRPIHIFAGDNYDMPYLYTNSNIGILVDTEGGLINKQLKSNLTDR